MPQPLPLESRVTAAPKMPKHLSSIAPELRVVLFDLDGELADLLRERIAA